MIGCHLLVDSHNGEEITMEDIKTHGDLMSKLDEFIPLIDHVPKKGSTHGEIQLQ